MFQRPTLLWTRVGGAEFHSKNFQLVFANQNRISISLFLCLILSLSLWNVAVIMSTLEWTSLDYLILSSAVHDQLAQIDQGNYMFSFKKYLDEKVLFPYLSSFY